MNKETTSLPKYPGEVGVGGGSNAMGKSFGCSVGFLLLVVTWPKA